MSKKSPPTTVEERSIAPASSPATVAGTGGSSRSWMSRAASRSRPSCAMRSVVNQSPSTLSSGLTTRECVERFSRAATRTTISAGSKGLAT